MLLKINTCLNLYQCDCNCRDIIPENEVKEKEVSKSPTKEDNKTDAKAEKENGDVCEAENGKTEVTDEADSKGIFNA